ncbi:MAG: Maf family protein [Candidatus Izemoplasma sp.]
MFKVILASASPRRKELLALLDLEFTVHPSNAEEIINNELSFEDVVIDIAKIKALDISKLYPNEYVLGFDTLVIHNNKALGKPRDEADAYKMLKELSGDTHRVLTGVCIIKGDYINTFYNDALVTFNELTDSEIEDYIKTKEPMDKAGSYGIQGHGAKFVNKVNGDFYTVMGLPISKLYHELKKLY